MTSKNRLAKTALTFSVGLIILLILIEKVGFSEAWDALQSADSFYVVLATLASLFSIYISGIRWRNIISCIEPHVSSRPLFLSLLSGAFVNNVTPMGKGGGEPLRAYLLAKFTGIDNSSSFATVLSDRIFDTMPHIILGYFSVLNILLFWHPPGIVLLTLVLAVAVLTVIVGIVFYVVYNIDQGRKILNFSMKVAEKFFPGKVKKYEHLIDDKLMLFNDTIKDFIKERRKLVTSSLLSIAIWGFWILRTYLVFLAFGVTVSFTVLTVVLVVSTFMGMIPFSPGGFGTTEGAMIILFSAFGIDASIAVGATVIDRFISFWMPSVLGAFSLGISHRTINRMKPNPATT
ncbi:MAG: flippase-like domain-containing protein [Candidatus Methanofastidiosa archaeon]|nr:flippase-like domain-containing protein [Candidatus Methanofastidiosa archaeon]